MRTITKEWRDAMQVVCPEPEVYNVRVLEKQYFICLHVDQTIEHEHKGIWRLMTAKEAEEYIQSQADYAKRNMSLTQDESYHLY